jgi:hypothetical protein
VLVDAYDEYPHSKFFLQWVAKKKDQSQVVGTVSVEEINRVGVYRLSVPKFAVELDGSEFIELTAVNQYTREVQILQVKPVAIGKYHFDYTDSPSPGVVLDSRKLDQAIKKLPLNLDYYVRPTF